MAAINMNQQQQIEDVEIVPGTEIMADLGDIHLVHAHNDASAVALIPQPSSSPSDPLNWSSRWKMVVIANQGFFVMISNITALSIAPLTPIYMAEWGSSLTQVAFLTGATVIALGYANFIIIPCSNLFGRRPVLLVCCLVAIGADIWQALASSYSSFLGARVINGLGAAANESIMTTVVADIFFLHQRGRFVGVYFMCYFVSLMLGPIIAGNIAARVTWRWFFWACLAAQVVNLISLLFLFPETRRMQRSAPSTPVTVEPQSPAIEKDLVTAHFEQTNVEAQRIDQHLGRGRPSRSQFNIIQPIDRECFSTIWHHIITPFELFCYPIIFWVAMAMGAAANALLCVNLIQSQALSAPPYNFNPANVGFANFALAVGAIAGVLCAGPFSDWVAMRATRKNRGIREPEMRLPALTPFIIATIIGMTVVGVGFEKQWPWQAVIILGFSLVGLITVSIPTITITYAIDCYKPVAGQIMVVSTVAKNTFGFGMTYYVNDWAAKAGFVQPVMLLMAMTAGFSLLGMIASMIWGKKMRRWTRNSKVHTF